MSYLVSVCIPAYEQASLLEKTLQSLQIQTFQDFELIISDDSLSPQVRDLSEQFRGFFGERLRYSKNTGPRGIPSNWNNALALARGEYIKIMHHDDWFDSPDALDTFVKTLHGNPAIDIAFCATRILDLRSGLSSIHAVNAKQLVLLEKEPTLMLFSSFIGSPSVVMFRRKDLHYFDTELKWFVDVDYYIYLFLQKKQFIFIPDPLVVTLDNYADRASTGLQQDTQRNLFELLTLFNKYRKHIPVMHRHRYHALLNRACMRAQAYNLREVWNTGYNGPVPLALRFFWTKTKCSNYYSRLIPARLLKAVRNFRMNQSLVRTWETTGKPLPAPALIKQRILLKTARDYKLNTLVETGTFMGDTVEASRKKFSTIYSIELKEEFYHNAWLRFREHAHIHLLNGNSSDLLPDILRDLRDPALFWLDAHYSGGETARGDQTTPVLEELRLILSHPVKTHAILIDDARCFIGTDGYPTVQAVEELVKKLTPKGQFFIDTDIIFILPG